MKTSLKTNLFLLLVLVTASKITLGRASCSIPSTPKFYCTDPFGASKGPYLDSGCTITCRILEKAICTPIGCDWFGNGHRSSCICKGPLQNNSIDNNSEELADGISE